MLEDGSQSGGLGVEGSHAHPQAHKSNEEVPERGSRHRTISCGGSLGCPPDEDASLDW